MFCVENHRGSGESTQSIQASNGLGLDKDVLFIPSMLNEAETKKLLSHLVSLYRDGEITLGTFETITKLALSSYAEKKVENKIDRIIRSKFDDVLGRLVGM
jgi:hypothetical protein